MKEQANRIRPGWVIEHEGRQYAVQKINLLQPGKGNAFIQVEMRDLETGAKTNERWRTQETVEKLMAEEKECQFLYGDNDMLNFMDTESYEQFSLPRESMGEAAGFLSDGMKATAEVIEGKPIAVNPPPSVILTVAETEPVVKGQTATSSYKPAILDNGMRTMVPPFVNEGEEIVVNTEDASYVERAKK